MLTAGKQASGQRTGQCRGPGVRQYRKALQLQLTEQGAEEEEEAPPESQRGARKHGPHRHSDGRGVYSERQGRSLEDVEQRSDMI